jgi:hypothetical protein
LKKVDHLVERSVDKRVILEFFSMACDWWLLIGCIWLRVRPEAGCFGTYGSTKFGESVMQLQNFLEECCFM